MECKDLSDLPQGNQSLSPERNINPSQKSYPRRRRGVNVRQTGNDRVSQREQTRFRVPEGAACERGRAGRRGVYQRGQQGCFSDVQFDQEVGAKVGPINDLKDECLDNAALVDDVTDSMTDLTLRDRLIAKLRSGLYSCLICLCYVEPRDPTWSCDGCFRVFHLSCMTDWALSTKLRKNDEPTSSGTQESRNSWRCPACQKSHSAATRPLVYYCFCGKTSRPDYHPGCTTIPHGCDEVCGKPKAKQIAGETSRTKRSPPCPHTCTELCHPGPCPPCTAVVQLHCPCGRVVRSARCGDEQPKPCGAPCGRTYAADFCAFGTHTCPLQCHDGDCPPCLKLIKSVCYCGRVDEVTRCGGERAKRYDLSAAIGDPVVGELDPCDIEMFFHDDEKDRMELLQSEESLVAMYVGTVFSCEQVCDRPLACGHHKCSMPCHPGECRPCPLSPSLCLTCPCGRVPLNKLVSNLILNH
uniref:PHD-type domain-containing protein n=1 Tax=Mesocestoides corti TaxID=53468 RepID=A0A5K3G1V8_MESCO